MHDTARGWVARHATTEPVRVLDIGGRDINGTVRDLFPNADYISIDLHDGPGVDIVADVTIFRSRRKFDMVVCCGVLEHTDADIVGAAHRLLRKGGTLVLTAAATTWEPHSAVDGGPLRPGEYYRGVSSGQLADQLLGWDQLLIDVDGDDIRALAVK